MTKNYFLRKLVLLLMPVVVFSSYAQAQCTNTTLYPTGIVSIPHNGTLTTITTAQYAIEYSNDSLLAAVTGDQYRFTSSVATDFLTLRDSAGNVLASGITPLIWTEPATPIRSVQLHVTLNAACATAGSSAGTRTTTSQLLLPFTFSSSTTSQPSTSSVGQGSVSNPVVRLSVVVSGSVPPTLTLTALNLTLGTTTSAADISNVKVYYNGTSSTFASGTQFGSTLTSPTTTFTVSGSQVLQSGTNYFFVTYDIACGATITNIVDASVAGFTVNGTNYVPTTQNPTGTNAIVASTAYNTIANGNWNNPAIWSCGSGVPTSSSNVIINNAVTVSTAGNVAANVTVSGVGALTIAAGGTLTLGTTGGGKQTFTNNGTLAITGGTLNVNGNVVFGSCAFNMSSGNFNLDPNDGTSAGSVASGTPTFAIGSSSSDVVTSSVNGGNILINDPPYAGTANSVILNSNSFLTWPGSTIKFGGDADTSTTTSTAGFKVDLYYNSGRMSFGNIIVNGKNTTTRVVTDITYGISAANDLTITAGSELRLNTSFSTFAGNIINNGTLTTTGTAFGLSLVNGLSSTPVASPNPQTIGGTGVFRNSLTAPTANILNLTINNSSVAGVTLNVPLSISGTLTLTAGKVNTTAANLLTLGYNATNAGTLSNTANAWVNGPFKRWITAATGNRPFPVGSSDSAQLSAINFTTAPTTAGTITAQWFGSNPGFPNATPLTEGTLTVNRVSPKGYWQMDAGDGLAGGNYTSLFLPKGYTDILDYTKLVLVKRPSAGGDWTLDGTHVTTTGSNVAPSLSRTGMSGFSQFAVGGQVNVALPITLQYLKGLKAGTGNALNWKVNCTSVSITMELERSSDSRVFKSITSITATQARCGQPFDYTDAAPLKGTNYYRLKMIDVDGKVTYSPIVAIINGGSGAELVGIYPTVVRDEAFLSVAASRSTKMQINITDMSGRVIKTISQTIANGSSLLSINTAQLSTGVYNITGMLDGVQTKTLRFVKQ